MDSSELDGCAKQSILRGIKDYVSNIHNGENHLRIKQNHAKE